jgi:hypothetical protein
MTFTCGETGVENRFNATDAGGMQKEYASEE